MLSLALSAGLATHAFGSRSAKRMSACDTRFNPSITVNSSRSASNGTQPGTPLRLEVKMSDAEPERRKADPMNPLAPRTRRLMDLWSACNSRRALLQADAGLALCLETSNLGTMIESETHQTRSVLILAVSSSGDDRDECPEETRVPTTRTHQWSNCHHERHSRDHLLAFSKSDLRIP